MTLKLAAPLKTVSKFGAATGGGARSNLADGNEAKQSIWPLTSSL